MRYLVFGTLLLLASQSEAQGLKARMVSPHSILQGEPLLVTVYALNSTNENLGLFGPLQPDGLTFEIRFELEPESLMIGKWFHLGLTRLEPRYKLAARSALGFHYLLFTQGHKPLTPLFSKPGRYRVRAYMNLSSAPIGHFRIVTGWHVLTVKPNPDFARIAAGLKDPAYKDNLQSLFTATNSDSRLIRDWSTKLAKESNLRGLSMSIHLKNQVCAVFDKEQLENSLGPLMEHLKDRPTAERDACLNTVARHLKRRGENERADRLLAQVRNKFIVEPRQLRPKTRKLQNTF